MLPSTASYRCMKTMMVGGQQVTAGSLLPKDSPLRHNPRRMEILYRTRMIQPAEEGPVTAKAVAKAEPSLLEKLTLEELQTLCKGRGLASKGTIDAVRARLASELG